MFQTHPPSKKAPLAPRPVVCTFRHTTQPPASKTCASTRHVHPPLFQTQPPLFTTTRTLCGLPLAARINTPLDSLLISCPPSCFPTHHFSHPWAPPPRHSSASPQAVTRPHSPPRRCPGQRRGHLTPVAPPFATTTAYTCWRAEGSPLALQAARLEVSFLTCHIFTQYHMTRNII